MNVSVKEAARRLSRNATTIRKWCKEGKLRHIRLPSGHFLITEDTINDILQPRTSPPKR